MDTYSASAVNISQSLDRAVQGATTCKKKHGNDGKDNDVSGGGKTKETFKLFIAQRLHLQSTVTKIIQTGDDNYSKQ
jgi:hypothetical protein